jgi:2-succinyl-6-hydroxy-2,4-cyclohexadiene-1-carboxylate synthase
LNEPIFQERPAVIFLHGFLGRGSDWGPVADALPAKYRSFAPDLIGHGENRPPLPARRLQWKDLHVHIQAVIDRLPSQPSRPLLVGYSMGGRAALSYACAFPDRLAGLVLESASPGISAPAARRERAALDEARADRIRADGLPAFLEDWYAAPLWHSLEGHPHKRRALLAGRSQNDPSWMARVLADLSPGRTPDLWPVLPDLPVPVLLLAGALDAKYTQIAPQAAARMPQGRSAIVPGAGHNIHLENPEAFLAHLNAFLAQVFAFQQE